MMEWIGPALAGLAVVVWVGYWLGKLADAPTDEGQRK